MAPSATPTPNLGNAAANIPSSQPHHPLQREGATIFLSPAEQAVENAMMRSSPAPDPMPESALGKQQHGVDDSTDGNDTEPNNESPSTTQLQSLPSISNVATATLCYALKKKLHPEQCEEVDAFLLVSTPLTYLLCLWLNIGQDSALGQQAKLFTCILSLENKVDAFRSAVPPYQLSDELKVV